MSKKVMVIAVHPDDETLGCGGTLLKHAANGDSIYWMIVTAMKTEFGYSQIDIERRSREIQAVSESYGFKEVFQLNFPPAALDQVPVKDLVTKISEVFNTVKPQTVYLPFCGDVHSDHRICFDAAYSCCKNFRYTSIKKIMMMETLSETEFAAPTAPIFAPNLFVDISGSLDKKIEIMNLYAGEMDPHPFPRSKENIRALATFRGAAAGCNYAESFMLIKAIQ